MADRPSLSSLPLMKKAPPPLTDADPVPLQTPEEPAPASPKKLKPDEKVVLMVRVTRADRKKIRQIAIANDTTVQTLVEEAVKDIVRRHRVRQP